MYLFLEHSCSIVIFSLYEQHFLNNEDPFLVSITAHHLVNDNLQRLKVELTNHTMQVHHDALMSELRDQSLHEFWVSLLVYDASKAFTVLAAHYPIAE